MSRLLTTTEAAEYLRLHPVTVRRKARAGEIPFIRLGGQWRFDEAILTEWVARGCPAQATDPDLFAQAAQADQADRATPAP